MTEARHYSSSVITPKFLVALGGGHELVELDGEQIELPINAQLWGVELTDAVDAISNHCFLVGRTAHHLGKALKEKGIPEYQEVDLGLLEQAAILHDIMKLPSRVLNKLSPEQKRQLDLTDDFSGISSDADEIGTRWLKGLGFPPQVYESIRAHDFPQEIINNPYWKIIVLSDAMAGPQVTTVEERVKDLEERWIKIPIANGLKPAVEEERFTVASINFHTIADEIFGALGTTNTEFIEENKLQDDSSMPKWERFLRRQRELRRELRTTAVLLKLEAISKRKDLLTRS